MNEPLNEPEQPHRKTRTSAPIGEYFTANPVPQGVSVDGRYLVLPLIALEHLSVSAQQDLVHLLSRIHQMTGELPWPRFYLVEAVRSEAISTLDESALQKLSVTAELDWSGNLIYRDEKTGRHLTPTELASPRLAKYPDPLYAGDAASPGR